MVMMLSLFGMIKCTTPFEIKNHGLPVCSECKHFEPAGLWGKSSVKYGKCKLFGEKNVLDGTIHYEYASIARNHLSCGINGNYYVHDPGMLHKVATPSLLQMSPVMLMLISYVYLFYFYDGLID